MLRRVGAGVHMHRIHRAAHDPLFFGPFGPKPEGRFDAPDGSYKVLHTARTLVTAFGETLVRRPAIPYILSSAVQARARSEIVTTRALRLYPLLDGGISVHGLSFTDLHGDAYGKTWAASRHIHQTTTADGILYTSRLDNQPCVALFERAATAIAISEVSNVSISPSEATSLAAHFGKDYVEP
ncbi:conserved hypothetical protein [Sphingomonas sp. EC-HK361]|nr:conserved hypothetical protein [Sphingomonas sp. EC-HK361]